MCNQAKNRISSFKLLSANWDSMGVMKIDAIVLQNCFKFIDALANDILPVYGDEIYPTPYGTVVLDFNSEKGLVSVEIGKEQLGYFTDFEDGTNCSSDGMYCDFRDVPDKLKEVLLSL